MHLKAHIIAQWLPLLLGLAAGDDCGKEDFSQGPQDAIASLSLLQNSIDLKSNQALTARDKSAATSLALSPVLSSQAFPMAWVHVPKTGTTLLNSLANLPGACNFTGTTHGTRGMDVTQNPLRNTLFDICPGSFAKWTSSDRIGLHTGVGSIYDPVVKGHGVIMLRQPEQRIMSGFAHRWHSWPQWYYNRAPKSMREYAEVVGGCAVKMLTRDGETTDTGHWDKDAPCGSPIPATAAEAHLAKQRLREGFLFVGITDDWDMSVCLFHLMFGGQCYASEFHNTQPNPEKEDGELYDTSELHGFIDVHDGLLYKEALRIYKNNLANYGASSSTCEPCFWNAGMTPSPSV